MIRRICILLVFFLAVVAEAHPGKGSILLLTTQQHAPAYQKELFAVIVFDQRTGVWRIPGGSIRPSDSNMHVNAASREVSEELHQSFNIYDLTNLNRSYTYNNKTVYVVGDNTCKGLFFLAEGKLPRKEYAFPEKFSADKLLEQIQTAQAMIPNTTACCHEVTDVKLVRLGLLRAWLAHNNLTNTTRFPVGQPVQVTDPQDPTSVYLFDYDFLETLYYGHMIESPTCPAGAMFNIMDDPRTRTHCDLALAPYFPHMEECFLEHAAEDFSGSSLARASAIATTKGGGACAKSLSVYTQPSKATVSPTKTFNVLETAPVEIRAGRRPDHTYIITSGTKNLLKAVDEHDLAPYFTLKRGDTKKTAEPQTVGFIDYGLVSAADLQVLQIPNAPNIQEMLGNIQSCRLMVHMQSLPTNINFSQLRLHPGTWIGSDNCRIETAIAGVFQPFNIQLKQDKSADHHLSDSFIYRVDGLETMPCVLKDDGSHQPFDFAMTGMMPGERVEVLSIIRTASGSAQRGYDTVVTVHRLYPENMFKAGVDGFCQNAATMPCQLAALAWLGGSSPERILCSHNYNLSPTTGDDHEIFNFGLLDRGVLTVPLSVIPQIFTSSGILDPHAMTPDTQISQLLGFLTHPSRGQQIVVKVKNGDFDDDLDQESEDDTSDDEARQLRRHLRPLKKYRQAGIFTNKFDLAPILLAMQQTGLITLPRDIDSRLCAYTQKLLKKPAQDPRDVYIWLENYLIFLSTMDHDAMGDGGMGLFDEFKPYEEALPDEILRLRTKVTNSVRDNLISFEQSQVLDEIEDPAEFNTRYDELEALHKDYLCWKFDRMIAEAKKRRIYNRAGHLQRGLETINPAVAFTLFADYIEYSTDAHQDQDDMCDVVINKAYGIVKDKAGNLLTPEQLSKLTRYIELEQKEAVIEMIREFLGPNWVQRIGI
ncbi:hypothetical protein [Spongorhabdus nitratireducens]